MFVFAFVFVFVFVDIEEVHCWVNGQSGMKWNRMFCQNKFGRGCLPQTLTKVASIYLEFCLDLFKPFRFPLVSHAMQQRQTDSVNIPCSQAHLTGKHWTNKTLDIGPKTLEYYNGPSKIVQCNYFKSVKRCDENKWREPLILHTKLKNGGKPKFGAKMEER